MLRMAAHHTPSRPDDFAGLEVGPDHRPLHLDRPLDATDHVRGRPGAEVELLEYGDYQCPFCAEALPGIEQMLARHGDRLLFAFRHFPLVSQHHNAWRAALAAEAAGRQQRFWEMHNHLFSHQHALSQDELLAHSRALGLDLGRFEADLRDPELAARVRRDAISGLRSGVTGTPTFFVFGRRLDGAFRPQELQAEIESAVRRPGAGAP